MSYTKTIIKNVEIIMTKRYEHNIKNDEIIFQKIVNKLDNYKDIALTHGVEINATRVHTTHGILCSDFSFEYVEEHNLSSLLGMTFDVDNFSYDDFRTFFYQNVLNYDEISEELNYFRKKFFKKQIDQFRVRNILYKRSTELLYLDISFSSLMENSFVIFVDDVTDYVKDKLLLEEFAVHNNILVKEVHHRVKNNLQILLSLINLQQRFGYDNQTISEYMKLSVSSMALIHNQLYTENLNYVSLLKIMKDFELNIKNLYGNLNIKFKFEINRDTHLSIDVSNPLFLILNELIINSIKHAFDDTIEEKLIGIIVNVDDDNMFVKYYDTGVGLNVINEHHSGLGTILIESLINQIDGKYELSSEDGYCMDMCIPIRK